MFVEGAAADEDVVGVAEIVVEVGRAHDREPRVSFAPLLGMDFLHRWRW